MKAPQTMSFARKLFVLAIVLGLSAPVSTLLAQTPEASPAPEASPGETVAQVEIPVSVFDASPSGGKDPFFPKSTRRNQIIETPKQEKTVTDVTKAIKLKGISGTLDQRLAIINNRTFAVGESDEIEVGTTRVHVLLKEIRQESVIVVINNAHWKELKLREGV